MANNYGHTDIHRQNFADKYLKKVMETEKLTAITPGMNTARDEYIRHHIEQHDLIDKIGEEVDRVKGRGQWSQEG
jgi:TATA-binding protein-associated factor Taf7